MVLNKNGYLLKLNIIWSSHIDYRQQKGNKQELRREPVRPNQFNFASFPIISQGPNNRKWKKIRNSIGSNSKKRGVKRTVVDESVGVGLGVVWQAMAMFWNLVTLFGDWTWVLKTWRGWEAWRHGRNLWRPTGLEATRDIRSCSLSVQLSLLLTSKCLRFQIRYSTLTMTHSFDSVFKMIKILKWNYIRFLKQNNYLELIFKITF